MTQVGSSNLWRTKLTQDIWQLFINWEEQGWLDGLMVNLVMGQSGIMIIIGQRYIDDDENAYSNDSLMILIKFYWYSY